MRVGLLSGKGAVVDIIIEKLLRDNHEPFIISIVDREYPDNVEVIKMKHANVESLLKTLKKNSISHLALVGKIDKNKILKDLGIPNLFNVEKGDIDLLKKLGNILNSYNIQILDLKGYLEDYIVEERVYTNKSLTLQEKEDIYFGAQKVKILANLEIGQAIIVKDKLVYSVEAIEGTDEIIRRTYKYGIHDGVLVKVGRDNQDFMYEIPAIGLETVKLAVQYNIKVIALESGFTLFLEQEEAILFANKNNLKIVGFSIRSIK